MGKNIQYEQFNRKDKNPEKNQLQVLEMKISTSQIKTQQKTSVIEKWTLGPKDNNKDKIIRKYKQRSEIYN